MKKFSLECRVKVLFDYMRNSRRAEDNEYISSTTNSWKKTPSVRTNHAKLWMKKVKWQQERLTNAFRCYFRSQQFCYIWICSCMKLSWHLRYMRTNKMSIWNILLPLTHKKKIQDNCILYNCYVNKIHIWKICKKLNSKSIFIYEDFLMNRHMKEFWRTRKLENFISRIAS